MRLFFSIIVKKNDLISKKRTISTGYELRFTSSDKDALDDALLQPLLAPLPLRLLLRLLALALADRVALRVHHEDGLEAKTVAPPIHFSKTEVCRLRKEVDKARRKLRASNRSSPKPRLLYLLRHANLGYKHRRKFVN
jgi:hypothetical protein